MPDKIRYKKPPIVERVIGASPKISQDEFEKRLPSWIEKIRHDYPVPENLAEWMLTETDQADLLRISDYVDFQQFSIERSSPRYLEGVLASNAEVVIVTKLCDNRLKPVLQTALLLGLRAPNSGVACRGCFRLIVSGNSILGDAWDEEHLKKVRSLKRAQCLPNN